MPQVQRPVAHTVGHLDLVAVTAPEMVSLLVVPTPHHVLVLAQLDTETGTGVGMALTVYRKDLGSYSIGGPYRIQCRDIDTGPSVGYSMLLPYLCSVG